MSLLDKLLTEDLISFLALIPATAYTYMNWDILTKPHKTHFIQDANEATLKILGAASIYFGSRLLLIQLNNLRKNYSKNYISRKPVKKRNIGSNKLKLLQSGMTLSTKRRRQCLEEAIEENDNAFFARFFLGSDYLLEKDPNTFPKAMEQFRECFRIYDFSPLMNLSMRTLTLSLTPLLTKLSFSKNPSDILFTYLLGAFSEYDKFYRRIEFNNVGKTPEQSIAVAEVLDMIVDKSQRVPKVLFPKRDEVWERVIQQVLEYNQEFEPIGETSNQVYVVSGDDYLGSTFLFEKGSNLESMVKVNDTIKKIVNDEAITSNILGIYDDTLIVKQAHAKTLYDLIQEGDVNPKIYEKIIRLIAKIHREYPTNDLISEDLKQGLVETIPKELISSINPSIIEEALKDSNLVFKKDPHPENFGIDKDNNIHIYDPECLGLIPNACDLANVFIFSNDLSLTQIENSLGIYSEVFNTPLSLEKYLNGVIYRGFRLSHALKSRKTRVNARQLVITNAQKAIERLDDINDPFFRDCIAEYCHLYGALGQIRNL